MIMKVRYSFALIAILLMLMPTFVCAQRRIIRSRSRVRQVQVQRGAAVHVHAPQALAVQRAQHHAKAAVVVQKANVCQSAACAPAVVHHSATAAVAYPQAYPQVQYFVGAPIRLEAAVQKVIATAQRDHITEEERINAAVRRALEQQSKQSQPEPERLPPPIGAAATVSPHSVLAARCAGCHTGARARGGFRVDQPISATHFSRAAEMLRTRQGPGEMAQTLRDVTTAEAGQIFAALLDLNVR